MLQLADDFSIPVEAVTETFAILAKRGAGKTYTASVLVEEMLKAGQQVIVADPLGVWWGLRASADGKPSGLPIAIVGGEHGDLPLRADMGGMVADLIVAERLAAVIDLSLLRKAEQSQFMTDFAETLHYRNRQPLHLVLDEADLFAPQSPIKGGERLLGAIDDIVRRGRVRGLGVTLISQRSAVINKNVLTQTEVLIALRTTSPQDSDAIDLWMKSKAPPEQRTELLASLASLPIGTAWISSPGWLEVFQQVHIRPRETFDSSATPKIGQRTVTPRLSDLDLATLRERFAALEDEPSDDVARLRNRILELEQAKAHRVEIPVLRDEQLSQLQALADQAMQQGQALLEFGRTIFAALQRIEGPSMPVNEEAAPVDGDDTLHLRDSEIRILKAVAQRHPTKLTRSQVGTLSGFTPSGGTFGNYFSHLKREGLIEESDGLTSITVDGLEYLGEDAPKQPQTTEELLKMWRGALGSGEKKMLDILINHYPHRISRTELGNLAGYTASGGTFGNYLGTLRRNGLIETKGDTVRVSDTLFIDERIKKG
jgi:hypothetical protein